MYATVRLVANTKTNRDVGQLICKLFIRVINNIAIHGLRSIPTPRIDRILRIKFRFNSLPNPIEIQTRQCPKCRSLTRGDIKLTIMQVDCKTAMIPSIYNQDRKRLQQISFFLIYHSRCL